MKNTGSVSNLISSFSKDIDKESKPKDIITFLESPWGLNLNEKTEPLLAGQKFILKLYYKIPLDETTPSIKIADKFNQRTLYTFTESEYLQYLYNEGRCNIKYIDNKPRNELVLIVGRRGTKCNYYKDYITTTCGSITYGELKNRIDSGEKVGIFTYDENWKKKITFDIKIEDNGRQPLYQIITSIGREEQVTKNHPYLIWRDDFKFPRWIEAKDIREGDRIAVAKSQELFGNTPVGSFELLDLAASIKYKKGLPSYIKRLPKFELAYFLKRMFTYHGSVFTVAKQTLMGYKSPNLLLLSDIQRELLKFGIISKPYSFNTYCNILKITHVDSAQKFLKEIGVEDLKQSRMVEKCFTKSDKIEKSLYKIPVGIWKILSNIFEKKNDVFITVDEYLNNRRNVKNPMRFREYFKRPAVYKNDLKEKLEPYKEKQKEIYNLLDSEILWDVVKSVKHSGSEKTIALEVGDTHIIGNDIISHNSTISSWVAVYETYKLLKIHHPQSHYKMLLDDEIHLTTVATSEDQANLLFRQITSHFAKSNYFQQFMNKPTANKVFIRTRRDIEKYGEDGRASIVVESAPCSARAGRGKGIILIIMDEQAHFVDEKSFSNKSDKAMYDALTPSIGQFGLDGKIINISSPLNKTGKLWDLYNQALQGSEHILMVKAPSWEINNTLSSNFLKSRYSADPIIYDCEFGGNFSDKVKAWMPEEYLRQVIIPDLKPKKFGRPRSPYFMGIDIGLKGDGTAIAITHVEKIPNEKGEFSSFIELDYLDVVYAGKYPFENVEVLDFELIADKISELCNRFYIVRGLFDHYNGELAVQNLAKKGFIQFELIHHTRSFNSELYQNFMMLVIDRKIRLYNEKIEDNDSTLVDEILKLQLKQYAKNIVEVSAPNIKGCHDDMSDALMRSVWLAAEALKEGKGHGIPHNDSNRYTTLRDSNHLYRIKNRLHNITDNKRLAKKGKIHNWTHKY